jgi:hypothetical protein
LFLISFTSVSKQNTSQASVSGPFCGGSGGDGGDVDDSDNGAVMLYCRTNDSYMNLHILTRKLVLCSRYICSLMSIFSSKMCYLFFLILKTEFIFVSCSFI